MDLNKNFESEYLPKSLNDIVFTYDKDKSSLNNYVTGRGGFPGNGKNGILLVGGTGSGKSTLAKMLPQLIEKARGGFEASPSYHQITSGSNNGVDLVEKIETNASLNPLGQLYNYIILDEVDLLTVMAMSRLKSAMNVGFGGSIFIMTTNDIARIDTAVVNRCHVIYLDHAPSSAWIPLYRRILSDHGINNVSAQTMLDNIDMCNGSGRDVIESAKSIILQYEGDNYNPEITLTSNVV